MTGKRDYPNTDDAKSVLESVEKGLQHPLNGKHSRVLIVTGVELVDSLLDERKKLSEEALDSIKKEMNVDRKGTSYFKGRDIRRWLHTTKSRAMIDIVTKRLNNDNALYLGIARSNPRFLPIVEKVIGNLDVLTHREEDQPSPSQYHYYSSKKTPKDPFDTSYFGRDSAVQEDVTNWGITYKAAPYYRQLIINSFLKDRKMKNVGSELFQITKDIEIDEISKDLLKIAYNADDPLVLEAFMARNENLPEIDGDLVKRISLIKSSVKSGKTRDKVLDAYTNAFSSRMQEMVNGKGKTGNLDAAIHFIRLINENNFNDKTRISAISLIDDVFADEYEESKSEEGGPGEEIVNTIGFYIRQGLVRERGWGGRTEIVVREPKKQATFDKTKNLLDLDNDLITESVWSLSFRNLKSSHIIDYSCEAICDFIQYIADRISKGTGGNQEWRNKMVDNLKGRIKSNRCRNNSYQFPRGAGCTPLYPRTGIDE